MSTKNIHTGRFNSPEVNNLAHAIAAPSLLKGEQFVSSEYGKKQYELHADWLRDLEGSPELEILKNSVNRKMPLGKRFETYLRFWMEQSPYIDLIAANTQLYEGKSTIGELDFIFKDPFTDEIRHWEVCLKFYLAWQDKPEHANFIGPNAKDRLDLKTKKLLEKQLPLMGSRQAEEKFPFLKRQKVRSRILMKGRIFYPLNMKFRNGTFPENACSKHQTGCWLHEENIGELKKLGRKWTVLRKKDWLSAPGNISSMHHTSYNRLEEKIHSDGAGKGLMLASVSKSGKSERFMIVRNDWPEKSDSLF